MRKKLNNGREILKQKFFFTSSTRSRRSASFIITFCTCKASAISVSCWAWWRSCFSGASIIFELYNTKNTEHWNYRFFKKSGLILKLYFYIIFLPFPVRSSDCVVDSGLDLIFDNAWGHIKSVTNKTKW